MSVETSQDAGIPPTETCMTCHSQIWQTVSKRSISAAVKW
jgi:hypothetical protein